MSGLIPLPDDYYHYAIKTRSSNNQQSNQTKEETQEDEKTVLANEENKREEKIKKYIGQKKIWTKELSEQKGSYTLDEPMKNLRTEDQIKIMKSNREYLKKIDFNSQVLILPDICVTERDVRRFEFENNFLKIVNRIDKCKQYLTDINAKIEKNGCFYFTGCKGSGKSHFLYLIASQLMTIDNYTVVYVPLCTDLIRDVLNALYVSCMASKEAESNERLKEQLNELKKTLDNFKNTSYDDQKRCIRDVNKAMNVCKQSLIFVIDQTNEIIRKPEYATEYTFLTSELLKYNIVLSGSANNEVPDLKLDTSAEKINETFVFNEDETMAFIHVRGKSIEDYVICLPEIIGITGGLPIEINRFLEIKVSSNTSNEINSIKASMDDRFRSYKGDFTKRYSTETLSKWYRDQSPDNNSIIIENITSCLTSNPIDDSHIDTFDKRIIKIEIKDGKTYLKPITALAYQCIMNAYHSQIQSEYLLNQFKSAMNFSLNAVSRGFYIEYHLILLLKLGLVQFFEVVPIVRNGDDDDKFQHKEKVVVIDLKSLKLELFMLAGRKAPHSDQITIGKNILFVPIDFNYPGYDFIILNENKKHLYYFNVTIMKNSQKHIVTNDNNAKYGELRKTIKSWLELFPLDQYKHYDIYVLPKSNLDLYSLKRSSNFVFFEDLAKKNPDLEYISSYFEINKQMNVKTKPSKETASKATKSKSTKESQYNDNENETESETEPKIQKLKE